MHAAQRGCKIKIKNVNDLFVGRAIEQQHVRPCNDYIGHNYVGHNLRGHNYIGHTLMGHTCIAHNYTGHNYIGHNDIGHTYIGHNDVGHNKMSTPLREPLLGRAGMLVMTC